MASAVLGARSIFALIATLPEPLDPAAEVRVIELCTDIVKATQGRK